MRIEAALALGCFGALAERGPPIKARSCRLTGILFLSLSLAGSTIRCGGGSSGGSPPPPAIGVELTPAAPQLVNLSQTLQFAATVSNTTNTAVTWSVTGAGTVSTSGLYTAPNDLPPNTSATVTATSQADSFESASVTVTITSNEVMGTPTAQSLTTSTGGQIQFTATVTGSSKDTGLIWGANGVQGGNSTIGEISASGLYTAPATVPSPNTVTVTASSAADPTKSASAQVTINPGEPAVTLNTPTPGATQLSGYAYNFAPGDEIVIYVLTNQWYVQPYVDAPFTTISPDGSWTSYTHPWQSIVVLLIDPANYTPAPTEITDPALDPGVIAWTEYPLGPVSVSFSGRTWGIKTTGTAQGDQFDPGPNFWSADPSVVNVAADGLHLKITQINGMWQCGEVYLLESLGYGTYTVQVRSHLDNLDQNTVAAPLFIYAAENQELDIEYSGVGGLIPSERAETRTRPAKQGHRSFRRNRLIPCSADVIPRCQSHCHSTQEG